MWKFVEKHSFCIVLDDSPKTARKCAFLQIFHTRKLGEITLFYAVKDETNCKSHSLQLGLFTAIGDGNVTYGQISCTPHLP